jgi:phosphoribosylformylglycinamidine cyclo-ligase
MRKTNDGDAYKKAGVDIDKGNAFVDAIKLTVATTHQPGVLGGIGGFSSAVRLDVAKYQKPVLVTSTDGVGTKLAVAKKCGKHDTIGIDLVAMCVNDLIVGGANPLCFLDYYATGSLNIETATEVVKGIAEGCRQAGCSLVGGETAEMPGLYNGEDYDLAGFVAGILDEDNVIEGTSIMPTDKIIGLASSGLHSNGYSLVRKIIFEEQQHSVDDYIPEFDCTIGDELLKPTRIYVQSVQSILQQYNVNGMVHNTGGGFVDNIPRILPAGCAAVINITSWPILPIFEYLQKYGNISNNVMRRTFNMGIGLMCIVSSDIANNVVQAFNACGEKAYIIGDIVEGSRSVEFV